MTKHVEVSFQVSPLQCIRSLSTKPRSQKVQYLLYLLSVLNKKLQMLQQLLAIYDIF